MLDQRRFLSCRDGLRDPPKPPKKRAITQGEIQRDTSSSPVRSKPKTKKIDPRPDREMEALEQLHERANFNLKLPEGQRLKLENPSSQLKRKRNPIPDPHIDLVVLNDSGGPSSSKYEIGEIDDDDDNLPEAHDLLNSTSRPAPKRAPSVDTNYSVSDIDSLIRNIPLDEVDQNDSQEINQSPPSSPPKKRKRLYGNTTSKVITSTPEFGTRHQVRFLEISARFRTLTMAV